MQLFVGVDKSGCVDVVEDVRELAVEATVIEVFSTNNAIIKLGPGKGFEINMDYCKGCGICVSECPASAITMISEV